MYKASEINGEDFLLNLCTGAKLSCAFKAENEEEFFEWKNETKSKMLDMLGFNKIKATELKPELLESHEENGYRLDKYVLPTADMLKMPLYVLVPHSGNGKVVVALHGHGVYGKDGLIGKLPQELEDSSGKGVPFALDFVRAGYVVVCPDLLGSGERSANLVKNKSQSACDLLNNALVALGMSLQGVILYELIKLVDFALNLKENKCDKVGVCGFSGGGLFTFMLSAFCDKVDATYASGYFHSRIDTCLQSNKCGCNFASSLWLAADMGELAAMIAPKPLFIEVGINDSLNGRSGIDGVQKELEKAKKAYALFNKEENLRLETGDGKHRWYGLGCDFFKNKFYLKNGGFVMAVMNILDFGAVGDGKTSCTEAIKKAVAQCAKNGGGTVFVPSGTYLTGAIFLESNMNLNLEAGATLLFSNDISEYPVVTSRWEGVKRDCYASCINADNAENISITGKGTLDGQGAFWWKIFRAKENEYPRPKLIAPYECKNVLIQGVTLKNSPSWTINTILCDNVTVDNVTINNPSDSPNTDGIDPESCTNVHISNCHIDVGDDCIAVKAGTEDTEVRVPCKNVTITNCTMVHGHGGVVLGSEMSGGIVNVTISNCVFEGTDRGIRLKSRRGRGGVVEDIRVDNVIMENVLCPFIANLYYFCGPRGDDKYVWDKNPYPITEETPAFRRLHFANMTCKEVNAAAGYFYGLAEQFVEDCTFENVYISMADNAVPGKPAMLAGIEDMAQKGFFLSNTKGISFSNVTVVGADGPAFEVENSEDIVFDGCINKNNRTGGECVKQTNVKNCVIK